MLLNCGVGEDSTRGHHQMVNTKIRLIIFFADFDARRDWGQEEKGTTKDEMAGWHYGLDGRESE